MQPTRGIGSIVLWVGYKIRFKRYWYKPKPMRSLGEIWADILVPEKETEGLLEEIIGGTYP